MKRLLLLLTGFQLLLYFPFATSGWAQESLPEDEDFLFELDLEALMDIEPTCELTLPTIDFLTSKITISCFLRTLISGVLMMFTPL